MALIKKTIGSDGDYSGLYSAAVNYHNDIQPRGSSVEYELVSDVYDSLAREIIIAVGGNSNDGWKYMNEGSTIYLTNPNGHTWDCSHGWTFHYDSSVKKSVRIVFDNWIFIHDIAPIRLNLRSMNTNTKVIFRNCKFLFSGGTPNIIHDGSPDGGTAIFSHCLFRGGAPSLGLFYTSSGLSSGSKLVFSDCSFIGYGNANIIRFNSNTLSLNTKVERTYIDSSSPLNNIKVDVLAEISNEIWSSTTSNISLIKNNIAFDESNFYSINEQHDLYAVPRNDSVMSPVTNSNITQTSIIPENTMGLNNIMVREGQRCVGAMEIPLMIPKLVDYTFEGITDGLQIKWKLPAGLDPSVKKLGIYIKEQDDVTLFKGNYDHVVDATLLEYTIPKTAYQEGRPYFISMELHK